MHAGRYFTLWLDETTDVMQRMNQLLAFVQGGALGDALFFEVPSHLFAMNLLGSQNIFPSEFAYVQAYLRDIVGLVLDHYCFICSQ